MFAFLRAFLWVFVAAQFLKPGAAEAQSHPTFYARILMDDDVQEVLQQLSGVRRSDFLRSN
jgi:hypothetical protein